ncbi:MAG TPA: hypothetical protein VMG12_11420 [Polyangiaceae bacterium]|nr:hypothetical protein [Polyangiaceae bacterium]
MPASALGLLALACSGTEAPSSGDPVDKSQALESRAQAPKGEEPRGEVVPIEKLPFVEPALIAETFMQRLREPTPLGENVALHVRLPPPSHAKLEKSLVRVLGEPENPLVLFSSDALMKLGKLEKSPGPGFFTAFLQLDEGELERRQEIEKSFGSVENGSEKRLVFHGRTPVAVSTGVHLDIRDFLDGGLIPLGTCPITPASALPRWEESLMVTDPAVVQDTSRTNDACMGGGAPNGVWTFKHLMDEMATGSGLSTHDFVVRWLSRWLRSYVVNGDTVPARRQMFNQVILPWANRSGVRATLSRTGTLALSGPLDLDQAPFRLSAIVNRLDLGNTSSGPSLYGGGTSSEPLDAGELRFVFGVQNLDTCSMLRFSVIFEYGVPITGCRSVRRWALDWTRLNNPSFAPRFSAGWLAHLESMTESVVRHGAAPGKGNDNALNQIRTNEIALGSPWELREFRLSIEDAALDTDTPANGALRPHTVAMTPDDSAFSPTPDATTDAFVLGDVLSGVPASVPTLPDDCSASFSVPGEFAGAPFRGGNSFTDPPTHWRASIDPTDNREMCARHQFSLNTCNGCHRRDTDTFFFHVDPTVMPAALSGFLTGGGGIWSVPDSQFNSPAWTFADLDRRYERLYDIACTTCGSRTGFLPGFLDLVAEVNVVVPIDPSGPIELPFEIGPVESIDVVAKLFDARGSFVQKGLVDDVALDGAVHAAETHVH